MMNDLDNEIKQVVNDMLGILDEAGLDYWQMVGASAALKHVLLGRAEYDEVIVE